MHIVGIGGGTGLPILLRGLHLFAASAESALTGVTASAVVCVSDSGGSSGVLRDAFAMPAVGDLRNCLVAMSDRNDVLGELFQHRLKLDRCPAGHPVGNLIVTALRERTGSLYEAVRQAASLLHSRGRVFPATEAFTTLCAEFSDGSVIRGEMEITRRRKRIRRVWLEPDQPDPTPGLLGAIHGADIIALGPGSLYTSVIPNLLVHGVADAIRRSPAQKVFICNLKTQAGETDGFTAADHLSAVEEYLGAGAIQACVVNTGCFNEGLQTSRAMRSRAQAVRADVEEIARRGIEPIELDLLPEVGSHARHDPLKLARAIVALGRDWHTRQSEGILCAAS